jgi:mono/diheme cytochrome c family protein
VIANVLSMIAMIVTLPAAEMQERTVADGVYTDAQAGRGAAAYDVACSGCHRPDLSGGTGPALKEQRFARIYAGKDLKTLYTKIATTMPRGTPASLADDVYLDIVAHVLKENGFKAGAHELTADGLEAIRVLPGQPKPPPPVGEYSYVEVVGCLTPGERGAVAADERERTCCRRFARLSDRRERQAGPAAWDADVSPVGCDGLPGGRTSRSQDVPPRIADQTAGRAATDDQRVRDAIARLWQMTSGCHRVRGASAVLRRE